MASGGRHGKPIKVNAGIALHSDQYAPAVKAAHGMADKGVLLPMDKKMTKPGDDWLKYAAKKADQASGKAVSSAVVFKPRKCDHKYYGHGEVAICHACGHRRPTLLPPPED